MKKKNSNIKSKKIGNLLVITGIILLAAVKAAGGWRFRPSEDKYAKYIEAATQYMQDEYYVEAIEEFNKADAVNPSCDVKLSTAECYLLLGDMINFKQTADKAESMYGYSERLYIDMVYYYEAMNDKTGELELLIQAVNDCPDNEYLTQCYDGLKGDYNEAGATFDEVYARKDGYDVVCNGDSAGVISGDVTVTVKTPYEAIYDIAAKEDIKISALKDGKLRYFDQKDYMRKTPEGDYKYIGLYRDGYALIEDNDGWAYIDEEGCISGSHYKAATAFEDGIAAVKDEGGWKLIDNEFKMIDGKIYTDIVRDDGQCMVFAGRIFAKTDSGYEMLDTAGNIIASGFNEVRPFMEDDGYAAVKDADGWKVMDTGGKIIEEVECEELLASGNNMMPYRAGDVWGYIGVGDGVYVEPKFEAALRVNANGYAAVKENGQWKYIHFTRFRLEEESL